MQHIEDKQAARAWADGLPARLVGRGRRLLTFVDLPGLEPGIWACLGSSTPHPSAGYLRTSYSAVVCLADGAFGVVEWANIDARNAWRGMCAIAEAEATAYGHGVEAREVSSN